MAQQQMTKWERFNKRLERPEHLQREDEEREERKHPERTQYLYFYTDGSDRTAIGTKPAETIPYEKIWAEEHPVRDNGDILYGMFTLAQGHFDRQTGSFTPGYGFPLASTPFESMNSRIYRTWQWGRSMAVIIPGIILLILLPFSFVNSFFAGLFAYALIAGVIAAPFLWYYGARYAWKNSEENKKAVEKQIRDQLYPPEFIMKEMVNKKCPICEERTLSYNPKEEKAYCHKGHGPWKIAF